MKEQSAIEYLTTYGMALLIIAIIAAVLYSYVSFAQAAPSSCVFSSYVTCKQVSIGSNSAGTQAVILLSNSQQYSIENPSLTMNSSATGTLSSSCTPNFVLPGGLIECVLTSTNKLNINQLSSGNLSLTTVICSGGTNGICTSPLQQTYAGTFSTHVAKPISPQCSLFIWRVASPNITASKVTYTIITQLNISGHPVTGGTVNFTVNTSTSSFSPQYVNTGNNGLALSYITSQSSGNVKIKVSSFLCSNSSIFAFTPSAGITFNTNQSINTGANILLLNNIEYPTLPVAIQTSQFSPAVYDYNSSISAPSGLRYFYSSISGCGATSQAGSIYTSSRCTVTANYLTQAYLTMASNPPNGGTVLPSGGWYPLGTYTINAIANSGYTFNSWSGSGTGSYSGTNDPATITLGKASITETANFNQPSNQPPNTYQLIVNSLCNGQACPSGAVTISNGGAYPAGTPVSISAANTTGSCYTFSSWSGSGTGSYSGSQPSPTVTMNSNIIETANFGQIQIPLTMETSPGFAGYAYSQILGSNVISGANTTTYYPCGSNIEITQATRSGRAIFNGWTGSAYTGNAATGEFILTNSATETAEYSSNFNNGGGSFSLGCLEDDTNIQVRCPPVQ